MIVPAQKQKERVTIEAEAIKAKACWKQKQKLQRF